MTTIVAPRVDAAAARLLDGNDALWSRASAQALAMTPTPLGYQPSVYVIAAWQERPFGELRELKVAALHTGSDLALRLEWQEALPVVSPGDINIFADAAGVLFPLTDAETPLETMGAPESPVNAWYWRPNLAAAVSAVGRGAGSVTRLVNGGVSARGNWEQGLWRVVFVRPFTAGEGVNLRAPGSVRAAFAVWRGANQERAGTKAYCGAWHEVRLEG